MASDFQDIKVGDVFFVEYRRMGNTYRLAKEKVDHVTPTQFHCRGIKYRKQDGEIVGSIGWDATTAEPATPKNIARYNSEQQEAVAIRHIQDACEILRKARGEDAIRLAALLPAELKADANV